MPASRGAPSNKQRLFLRYFTGILIDLTVLNLFVEYSKNVVIDSFTISLLAAVLLQVLLKATIALEHRRRVLFQSQAGRLCEVPAFLHGVGSSCSARSSSSSRRFAFAFGDDVYFGGPFHGIVVLIVVVIVMLVAEEADRSALSPLV